MNIPTRPPRPPYVPATPRSPNITPFNVVGGGNGLFPASWDGGIPANAQLPNNPAQAFIHQNAWPADTAALYYGNGCDVRLRPHVVNSIISEIAATIDRAGVAYRQSSLQNLEVSIRYLIQRGLPRAALLVQQNPFFYNATLDPVPPYYSDFMTVTFVPQLIAPATQNQGYVRINTNGLGFAPLFRNDGMELEQGDILPGKPFIAAYWQGAWYYISLCASQVPILKRGGIGAWIRTDGNDITGDGTANSPDKAFRTLDGAWAAIGDRYAVTPSFSINFMLGIPGTYEAGNLGPFGSTMSITGDRQNPLAYRISNRFYAGSQIWVSLLCNGINQLALYGITLTMTQNSYTPVGLWANNSTVSLDNTVIDCVVSHPGGRFVYIANGSVGLAASQTTTFNGNGNSLGSAIFGQVGGNWIGCGDVSRANHVNQNFHCSGAYLSLMQLSNGQFIGTNFGGGGVTGKRWHVSTNSTLVYSNPIGASPGDEPGTLDSGGQFVP